MTAPAVTDVSQIYDTILILDFGSQYTHLIARRIRELGVYCELQACTVKMADIKFKPKGVILSGSPYSVYDHDAPHVDPAVFDLSVPILGICYGLQEIAQVKGAKVGSSTKREYGKADLHISHEQPSQLFTGFSPADKHITVWMSHGDKVDSLPPGFRVIATTSTSDFAAIDNEEERIWAIQFHPEVSHTPRGTELLQNFVCGICHADASWTMTSFVDKEIERIRSIVGPTAQVIGAVSGGVDSTVAARLLTLAIGDRFHAILVDNGVMRLDECTNVLKTLQEGLGINVHLADAADLFLGRLKGVTDPEKKRKIIGNTFIEVFEENSTRIEKLVEQEGRGKVEFLLQGTLYPDVIESISFKGPSATIKTHHNVGGLLDDMKLKLIEPLRELFKDEVRALGKILQLDDDLVWRHPFPGPGIAIRILGEVTKEQVDIVRHADHIYIEEIKKAGLYRQISQAYAALLPIRSVGVMGDKRTYEQVIALRAVETRDFMTADWFEFPYDILKRISSRIINEVAGVNRVVYDVSSKPPSTIEWE
ncbi:GMP synthase (glutamine-hydrolysing) [Synchytrium microbalum]|uniref:GMP synthase [glutamine-hydrolyzing] n=1 Tax=Synchytrium microbalum TaxID=1806994 RepID=A0A507CAN7_9FUNG|nr:GMP synthase (glutamine-hydrolysing) [Synchytrium microbalum]TPX35054.1 GMP synthase (glutamine-hydrolysing) [Synchytrium microbalum]